MHSVDRAQAYIARLGVAGVCDDCLALALQAPGRTVARQLARRLVGANGFERRKSKCSMCGAEKIVTSKH